jgi:hypothetical protein|uniref:Uncharacterized protein n=1 Tax=Globisporangium ultimum (strain ATCC 200006 / CBS 805.95 / DAOM BR144) TaxID=431595 RepID=K3X7Q3_GLOUD
MFFVLVFVGVHPFQQIQDLKVKVQCLTRMMGMQMTLTTIYPIYSALFLWFSSEQQTLFLVTLPVLKLVMKNLMARTFRGPDMEDALPEITVFTVEIFNALYVSMCLQLATSAVLSMIIVVSVDTAQSLIAIRGVLVRSDGTILQELFSSKRVYSRQTSRGSVNGELLPLPEYPASVTLGDARVPMAPVTTGSSSHQLPLNSVLPIEMLQTQGSTPPQQDASSKRERARIEQHVTHMLFNCEYLVLVEYIECVIPMLYAVYTALLFHLPNGAFYPHIASLTPTTLRTAMGHLSAYIALEISTLLGLCAALH